MVTSFISRWSKRKLEENPVEPLDTEQHPEQLVQSEALLEEPVEQLGGAEIDVVQDENQAVETLTDGTQEQAQSEPLSIASLLASEAERSVKKAALRKLFLSEEFNVRDGLDDYDEDYSNLKTLSQSVAETLRDWVKDREEEPSKDETVATTPEETQLAEELDQEPTSALTREESRESIEPPPEALAAQNSDASEPFIIEQQDNETKYTTR